MAEQSQHLRRRRRLFRQARPSRQGRRLPARRRRAATGSTCWAASRPTRSSCIPRIRRPCSPAPTTACGAAPTAAPPSSAPTSPTQEAGLVASWSTAAIPKKMLAGASPIDVYRSDDGGESWRKLATPDDRRALQGPVRLARDALRAEPEEAGRDLRRARDQRRDAQHRRRRDLDRLQRRPDQARRAAASQEQDRERHHGRGHARRPCRDDQSGRSRFADPGAAHGPVPHHRPRQDLGGHGDQALLADHLRPRRQGLADRAQHALCRALGRRLEPRRRRSIAARTAARAGSASTRSRCTAPSCRSACTTAIPNQVYIGARYDGEMFGTQDGGKTWQAMPLPGEVQHIYSVACG